MCFNVLKCQDLHFDISLSKYDNAITSEKIPTNLQGTPAGGWRPKASSGPLYMFSRQSLVAAILDQGAAILKNGHMPKICTCKRQPLDSKFKQKRASMSSNHRALQTILWAAAVLCADSMKVAVAMDTPNRQSKVSVSFGEAKMEKNLFVLKAFN